ncbi:ricin-type beta-trefoil lectin domain protein [Streptomyces sp. SP18BB07]|uniref:ricin-type beta-trefoil lectin domain protein n=1 Tax=Streptomyces sp. SP18BB07 TaxID=3002522 RepID=UPI003FCEA2D1
MALSGTEDDRETAGAAVSGPTRSPSGSAPELSTVTPSSSASTAPGASETLVTRLRNVRTGLCLDLRASAEVAGAPAVTAECGGSATQMWWLEDGGRLRNQAAPGLCLNAEPQGTVALRPCAAPESPDGEASGDTRYDLAADGLLTLDTEPGVALTPVRRAEGSIILLEPVPQDRVRRSQRWRTDEASAPSPHRRGSAGSLRPQDEAAVTTTRWRGERGRRVASTGLGSRRRPVGRWACGRQGCWGVTGCRGTCGSGSPACHTSWTRTVTNLHPSGVRRSVQSYQPAPSACRNVLSSSMCTPRR